MMVFNESSVLENVPCCPAETQSLVVDTGALFGSHDPELVFDVAALFPVQPAVFLSGLSCSNMAKASISACSDVNMKELKEPDEALILWP